MRTRTYEPTSQSVSRQANQHTIDTRLSRSVACAGTVAWLVGCVKKRFDDIFSSKLRESRAGGVGYWLLGWRIHNFPMNSRAICCISARDEWRCGQCGLEFCCLEGILAGKREKEWEWDMCIVCKWVLSKDAGQHDWVLSSLPRVCNKMRVWEHLPPNTVFLWGRPPSGNFCRMLNTQHLRNSRPFC